MMHQKKKVFYWKGKISFQPTARIFAVVIDTRVWYEFVAVEYSQVFLLKVYDL